MTRILKTVDRVNAIEFQHTRHAEAQTERWSVLARIKQQQLSPPTIRDKRATNQRCDNRRFIGSALEEPSIRRVDGNDAAT